MPRVLPSEVVAAIDALFGANRSVMEDRAISISHQDQVRTLLELLNQIPSELLTLPSTIYVEYLTFRSALASAVVRWGVGDADWRVTTRHRGDAAARIRDILLKCPDRISPPMPDLLFIPDGNARQAAQGFIQAAWQDFRAEEWVGATLFAATAAETLLFWGLKGRQDFVNHKKLETEGLKSLVKHALSCGLIGESTANQASACADGRNLIHPGKVARTGLQCGRGTALAALAALEFVTIDLTKSPPAVPDKGLGATEEDDANA